MRLVPAPSFKHGILISACSIFALKSFLRPTKMVMISFRASFFVQQPVTGQGIGHAIHTPEHSTVFTVVTREGGGFTRSGVEAQAAGKEPRVKKHRANMGDNVAKKRQPAYPVLPSLPLSSKCWTVYKIHVSSRMTDLLVTSVA